ncbi:MAG: MarR family transcriptional regulator [Proteobacteria bacterium]|nr:MAG: MarR family transcriptional regulator [Pseudomonadota bacterium]
MKFEAFRDRSLIMGLLLASQSVSQWLKREITEKSDLSVLGSLILTSIHFEGRNETTGPSRLSSTLGVSRSRISQELSALEGQGLIRRVINSESARSTSLLLTAAGEKKANELIKTYTRLQRMIDAKVGENHAEATNRTLLKLTDL